MTPATKSVPEAHKPFASPMCATVEGKIRDACDTVEDRIAQTRIQVRRHPFVSLSAVAGAAAVLGCVVGFVVGRRRQPQ